MLHGLSAFPALVQKHSVPKNLFISAWITELLHWRRARSFPQMNIHVVKHCGALLQICSKWSTSHSCLLSQDLSRWAPFIAENELFLSLLLTCLSPPPLATKTNICTAYFWVFLCLRRALFWICDELRAGF